MRHGQQGGLCLVSNLGHFGGEFDLRPGVGGLPSARVATPPQQPFYRHDQVEQCPLDSRRRDRMLLSNGRHRRGQVVRQYVIGLQAPPVPGLARKPEPAGTHTGRTVGFGGDEAQRALVNHDFWGRGKRHHTRHGGISSGLTVWVRQ